LKSEPQIEPVQPPQSLTEVAIAILHQGDRLLMQLRDDDPRIIYPGYWALFGGHLEPGETPLEAMQRELAEEIGYVPPRLTAFQDYPTPTLLRHVFQAPLERSLEELTLGEGQDMALATQTDVQRGAMYSPALAEERPLGPPHRQILLDFIASDPANI